MNTDSVPATAAGGRRAGGTRAGNVDGALRPSDAPEALSALAEIGASWSVLWRARRRYTSDREAWADRARLVPGAEPTDPATPERIAAQLRRAGMHLIPCGQGPYTADFARYEPELPPLLWARGDWPDGPVVTIVGTRRCTGLGSRVARLVAEEAAGAGWTVASGLARGIDGAAHRGSLRTPGRSLAVLGSGLGWVYPPEHGDLAGAIAESGIVLSPYPTRQPPRPWQFPLRNRLLAALAVSVVVVEAHVKGGALSTAALARIYGRDVYAVPGAVSNPASVGTNRLLADGAIPLCDSSDFLPLALTRLAPPEISADPFVAALAGGPLTLDGLAAAVGEPTLDVARRVVALEMAGVVVRAGARYALRQHGPAR